MDTVIFEEFKRTGNLEIVLDRRLVDKPNLAGPSTSTAAAPAARKCCWIRKSTAASAFCAAC